MPRQDVDQEFRDGVAIDSTPITRGEPVVSESNARLAKQTLKTMMATFTDASGAPTGTPTNAQIRNWLVALTMGLRHFTNELDDEE